MVAKNNFLSAFKLVFAATFFGGLTFSTFFTSEWQPEREPFFKKILQVLRWSTRKSVRRNIPLKKRYLWQDSRGEWSVYVRYTTSIIHHFMFYYYSESTENFWSLWQKPITDGERRWDPRPFLQLYSPWWSKSSPRKTHHDSDLSLSDFFSLVVQIICLSVVNQGCPNVHDVQKGETCITIAKNAGISVAQLIANNPQINEGCTNIRLGEVKEFFPFF